MKIQNFCLLVLTLTAICGCGTVQPKSKEWPDETEFNAANYGTAPDDYQQKIPKFFESILIDPESAKYEFARPVKAVRRDGRQADTGGVLTPARWVYEFAYGYSVTLLINSKNSFGGYTGQKPVRVFFLSGVPVDYEEAALIFGRYRFIPHKIAEVGEVPISERK